MPDGLPRALVQLVEGADRHPVKSAPCQADRASIASQRLRFPARHSIRLGPCPKDDVAECFGGTLQLRCGGGNDGAALVPADDHLPQSPVGERRHRRRLLQDSGQEPSQKPIALAGFPILRFHLARAASGEQHGPVGQAFGRDLAAVRQFSRKRGHVAVQPAELRGPAHAGPRMAAIEHDPEPVAPVVGDGVDEPVELVVADVPVASLPVGIVGNERFVQAVLFIAVRVSFLLVPHLRAVPAEVERHLDGLMLRG